MNEAETRAKLIDPALHAQGWHEGLIRREETKGAIELVNGKAKRRPKRTDYVLRYEVVQGTQPVALALIEAKAESLPPGHGMEQGKSYSKSSLFDVKFVFASNGHQFVEFDHFTGLTSSPRPMAEFPTPEDLRRRYEEKMGFGLADEAAKPLLQPYKGGESSRRYYQDAAIRSVLERIAQDAKKGKASRALLSLATGSGKTRIAVQLLTKLKDAGQLKRALFLCDRDELRSQALTQFQDAFGNDAAVAGPNNDGGNTAANAKVQIVTYQTLGVDKEESDPSFLLRNFPKDYFSHIIIDECHRSAWGKWSQVLLNNSNAVQVGLTATPRQIDWGKAGAPEDQKVTADNLEYFGEPVYEYTMTQAVEDGYLAACLIQKGRVNIDDTGLTIEDIINLNPRDARTGDVVSEDVLRDLYDAGTFERQLMLPDRVLAMCQDLFQFLVESGGPHQKTIIFCVRDWHADAVAAQMNNFYAKWCEENGHTRAQNFAFKCTAASGGNDQLADFRGSKTNWFVATTVDLITTGVDVPAVRNIAFFRYIKSPILFHQMLGRGTRLDDESGKMMFTVYDYTDATRLLSADFITDPPAESESGEKGDPPVVVTVDGVDVHISDEGKFVVMERDGKPTPVPLEVYEQEVAERMKREAPTAEVFRRIWIKPDDRRRMIDALVDAGYSPEVLRRVKQMGEYDLYDVLGESAYGILARTREDRTQAFKYKSEDWLLALPKETQATLLAITAQFKTDGTDGLESHNLLRAPDVTRAGGLDALRKGGDPGQLVSETKERVFRA